MGELVRKWRGPTWQAMLTREPYGLHFSVSAQRRKPTDAEVDRAFASYKFGLWVEEHMEEITSIRPGPILNPYVRHFVPDAEAERLSGTRSQENEPIGEETSAGEERVEGSQGSA